MNVASILKLKGRAVSTARPDASLLDVAQKLGAKKIGAIVVVGDNGHVAGIISERDLIRAIAERGAAGTHAHRRRRHDAHCRVVPGNVRAG